MKTKKTLDCVKMKNAIQAQIRKEQEGLSEEEIERRRRRWLRTSDDPLARLWRSLEGGRTREAAGKKTRK